MKFSRSGDVLGYWSRVFLYTSPREHEICPAGILDGESRNGCNVSLPLQFAPFPQLTVACGDLIVTLVVSSKILEDQAMEFLLFAGLMFVDILIFLILALRYKTIAPETIRNLTELWNICKFQNPIHSNRQ